MHLHALEARRQLAAAQLELLDDVADLLEAVHVLVRRPLAVRDHLPRRAPAQVLASKRFSSKCELKHFHK